MRSLEHNQRSAAGFAPFVVSRMLTHTEVLIAMLRGNDAVGLPAEQLHKIEAALTKILMTATTEWEAARCVEIRSELQPMLDRRCKRDLCEAVAHTVNERGAFRMPRESVSAIVTQAAAQTYAQLKARRNVA